MHTMLSARKFMLNLRTYPLLLLFALFVAGNSSALTAAEPTAEKPEGGLLIGWDGLDGWQHKDGSKLNDWDTVDEISIDPNNPKKLITAKPDGLSILINVTKDGKGGAHNAYTKAEYGDVSLHVEFFIPEGSNSGIYLQGRYEIQILDSYGVKDLKYSDCGGIYERGKKPNGYNGHALLVNASLPPGEWQSFDIDFQAPRFDANGKKSANGKFLRVLHNGKLIHENVEVTGPTRAAGFSDEQPTGPIMIQDDHGPVAYRNMRVKKLKPAD